MVREVVLRMARSLTSFYLAWGRSHRAQCTSFYPPSPPKSAILRGDRKFPRRHPMPDNPYHSFRGYSRAQLAAFLSQCAGGATHAQ